MDRSYLAKMALGLDPVLLMQAASMEPDPWQVRFLRSTSPRIMLMCGRQMGKSTITGFKALSRGISVPDSLILLVSRSQDQADELFLKICKTYYATGQIVPAVRPPSKSELSLVNGARIIALPNNEETIRCYSSVSLLIVDEAARVQDSIFAAVTPMLAVSRGDMVWLSTPRGRRGLFGQEWESSNPEWERIRARASQCPRIPPEFLAEERRRLGERMYQQEYEAEIVEFEDTVFSPESIDSAFDSDLPALAGW
jgi:hypothetical protein